MSASRSGVSWPPPPTSNPAPAVTTSSPPQPAPPPTAAAPDGRLTPPLPAARGGLGAGRLSDVGARTPHPGPLPGGPGGGDQRGQLQRGEAIRGASFDCEG